MQRSIEINDLLTYSDIYNLGLTDADVTHLKAIHSMYAKQLRATYYYKATPKKYDLALEFWGSDYNSEPVVSIIPRHPEVEQLGYPALALNDNTIFLGFLPKVADALKIDGLTSAYQHGYDQTTGQPIKHAYKTLVDFQKDFFESQIFKMRGDEIDHEFIQSCYWIAGLPYPTNAPAGLFKKDYADMPKYIQHIAHVIQLKDVNDTRVAFIVNKREWYGSNFEVSYDFYTTIPGTPEYNWTDVDKYVSHTDTETGKPRVAYIDKSPAFPREAEVIDNYRRGQAFVTLDNATLNMLNSRWMRKQQEIANEKAAVKALEGKIKDKIAALDKGQSFNYNDITFTRFGFEYENQHIESKDIESKKVLQAFSGQYSEEHLNFDRVFDTWLNIAYRQVAQTGTIDAKIGDVDVVLTCVKKVAKNGVNNFTYRVNGHRINKDEVLSVLSRAVCFPGTPDFEEFCDSVESCSLKYHKLLSTGIMIKVFDEIFEEQSEFKITLEREKNKNYIIFNGKKFKVADTNRLLSLCTASSMSRVIGVLLNTDVVGMSGDDIKFLLQTGKQSLLDQRNREKELLESTMKLFNIERITDFRTPNGKNLSGYLVQGKMRNYLVEEQKCMVYEYPTGRYICMVDKGQNEHSNVARLVNRFYALSNDSKLAKEISTL